MNRFMMLAATVFLSVSMVACTVAGASGEYPSTKIRYKMTVEVDTPEGVKTGSAVREIAMVSRPKLMGESNDTHVKLEKGEAVVVDLGQRGVLFVLMSIGGGSGQAIWAPFNAFPSSCSEGAISRCSIKYYANLKNTGEAELSSKFYPGMIYFKDRQDPKSVERVVEMSACQDPQTGSDSHCIKADHFERIFGQGVRLKSVTVEMTEENIKWTIYEFLPWFKDVKAYIDGQRYGGGPELSNILERSDFIVGEK